MTIKSQGIFALTTYTVPALSKIQKEKKPKRLMVAWNFKFMKCKFSQNITVEAVCL